MEFGIETNRDLGLDCDVGLDMWISKGGTRMMCCSWIVRTISDCSDGDSALLQVENQSSIISEQDKMKGNPVQGSQYMVKMNFNEETEPMDAIANIQ